MQAYVYLFKHTTTRELTHVQLEVKREDVRSECSNMFGHNCFYNRWNLVFQTCVFHTVTKWCSNWGTAVTTPCSSLAISGGRTILWHLYVGTPNVHRSAYDLISSGGDIFKCFVSLYIPKRLRNMPKRQSYQKTDGTGNMRLLCAASNDMHLSIFNAPNCWKCLWGTFILVLQMKERSNVYDI